VQPEISAVLTVTSVGPHCFLNDVFEDKLRGGLFEKLSFERRVALFQVLLDLGCVAEAVRRCAGQLCTRADIGLGYAMQKHT
jgi:hypothetical protein